MTEDMTTNPFIKTVTKKRVTNGKKTLAGGTVLTISSVNRNFLRVSLSNEMNGFKGVGMGLGSLRGLATILTEICDVMEEK